MPKLKTKSGAKKRFKVTATGKVVAAHAGKRHGMIKRTKKQIRQLRGTRVLFKTDGDNIKRYFLPKEILLAERPSATRDHSPT
jgi:large subunit ribosomal protein L35